MDKKTHSNRKWITACAAAMLFAATAQAQDKVTVTDRPLVSTSSNYTNFRAPLRQAPLLKLPVGQVQPRGWLRKYLELQRDGLNGKLNTISAWLDKNNNQWLSDSGDHGWEEVPYWLRGYCSLAYILDDEDMKKEAQGFREPATYYMYNNDPDMLQATYNAFNTMRKHYGQVPGGMYGADENARDGYFDPRQGAETCAIVEQMASDEILMGITGDPFWADHCENVALNTFTAAMTSDMKALRYITSPNMAISDEKLHGPSIDNNLRGMLSMSPFSSRCCQHNHGMGWPYYAEHLVMATSDNGLATMLYAANETTAKVGAGGHTVRLTEDTEYPFEEKVTLTVHTGGEGVTFPLYLRVPAWSDKTAVSLNGKSLSVAGAEGKYVRIEREWQDGDKVELEMPMSVTSQVWQQNKGSVSVNYGPMTLSLKIKENFEQHDSRDPAFVQDDSHWQEGVDASLWPCYVLKPESQWNYALKVDRSFIPSGITVTKKEWPADDMPFTAESVPLEFSVKGYQIPSWGYDATGMTDQLPVKWAERSTQETSLTLIPMGAARLRISAFPKVVDGE